ncbi:hypothetical protein H6P81_020973 [Aristolochia fimbriata]|uniref:NAB domain-containing protein n=1 Tax=Aristolochia fimbriata TaxID=158543 RepID=A0AAV7E070_ARIFI|nr:hypothetical protein H6P81_020973 [Aristolochia fimbriata]
MLQRAASNAYSWWWVSHIRTKQSKWLEQSLLDMEDKVAAILKLIEEEADSFAKKAEMYYRKRPELINFVQESYRAYRSLAERYDHISGELQNANNTIANMFPDQVQFSMDEEDDEEDLQKKLVPNAAPAKTPRNAPNIPKPNLKIPEKETKPQLPAKKPQIQSTPSSNMINEKAREEIDRLQKDILVLQTEKEFVKSSYESAVEKYWSIEEHITEMQDKVCTLQDEFNVDAVIEDDEARALMATTALKSCEETLARLQEQQKLSSEEAKAECQKVKTVEVKLKAIKGESLTNQPEVNKTCDEGHISESSLRNLEEDLDSLSLEIDGLKSAQEKVKEDIEINSDSSLPVSELAEKIDELVNKVLSLENSVSSQTAVMQRLRSENHELQKQLQTLEEHKVRLVEDSKEKLKEMEDKLHAVQDHKSEICTRLSKACPDPNDLSGTISTPKQSVEGDKKRVFQEETSTELPEPCKEKGTTITRADDSTSDKDVTLGAEDGTHEIQNPNPFLVADYGQVKKTDVEIPPLEPNLEKEIEKKSSLNGQGSANTLTRDLLGREVQYETTQQKEEMEKENPEKGEFIATDSQTMVIKGHELQYKNDLEKPKQEEAEKKDSSKWQENADAEVQHKAVPVEPKQKEEIEKKSTTAGEENANAPLPINPQRTEVQQETILEESMQREELEKKSSIEGEGSTNAPLMVDTQGLEIHHEDPLWQQLFYNGFEEREKVLLSEYTSILRNYKDIKKKLSEVEKKNQETIFRTMAEVRELKSANAMKDLEIRSLKGKLNVLQVTDEASASSVIEIRKSQRARYRSKFDRSKSWVPEAVTDFSNQSTPRNLKGSPTQRLSESSVVLPSEEDMVVDDEPSSPSTIEEKFRRDIDEILEENLEFWLRFTTSVHEIEKFQTSLQELKTKCSKLKQSKKQSSSSTNSTSSSEKSEGPKSEVANVEKRLRELQAELSSWLEQNALLKEELQSKLSSLTRVQEEISKVSTMDLEDEQIEFTSLQAARFQGEVLSIEQENNKVADELQVGFDHVKGLQSEVEKTVAKLKKKFGSSSKLNQNPNIRQCPTVRNPGDIPLRSFIFGAKPKKAKPSIFSFVMNPNLYKQNQPLKTGGRRPM